MNTELTAPEIATREAVQWFSSLWNHLPNPDTVLRRAGKTLADYRELLYDPHTAACEQSRKAGVLSLEWTLRHDGSDEPTVQRVRESLDALNVYSVMETILDAPFFGMQPIEVLWDVAPDGVLVPQAVVGKPPEWFLFDVQNRLRLRTREQALEGIELPPYRFLLPRNRPTYQNPYGVAVLSRVWWAQFFKKNVQRFWNTFSEKYGSPYLLLNHNFANDQRRIDALVQSAVSMVQDAVIALPEGAKGELLGVTGTSNADMYREFLSFCNAEISKAILGQTLSTETSTQGGSYAATKVHFDVRREIIDADKRLVEQTMNQLLRWVYELNFPNAAVPMFRLYEESEVSKTRAERDKILWETGVRFTKSYYTEQYELKDSDFELPPTALGSATAPSAAPRRADFAADNSTTTDVSADTVQTAIDAVVMSNDAEYYRQAGDVLAPIVALFKGAKSYRDVSDELAKRYKFMDSSRFSATLQTQMAVVSALGTVTVLTETGTGAADFSADDPPKITPERIAQAFTMQPDEALEFLFGKESEIYKSFKGVPAEVFRIVFTVAGVMQMDALMAIRAVVEQALAEGLPFEEFKQRMTENELIARTLPPHRFQTIYRTNLQSAFMAARYTQQMRIAQEKPFWKFVAVVDGSTTQGCKSLDGKIFKFDDGFWNVNYPPRHYNCRSRVVVMNERELERYGGTVESGDRYENFQPDPSFATRPTVPFEPRKQDYPSDIWQEYEKRKKP